MPKNPSHLILSSFSSTTRAFFFRTVSFGGYTSILPRTDLTVYGTAEKTAYGEAEDI
jgi:hypothetical protein